MGYCIYKICCDNIDYVYIGSTTNFTNRKSQHKSRCNNENGKHNNFKLYKTIRDNGGWQNWRMVIIDELGDVSKRQAEMKEEEWRVELQANLNSKKCYITEEEEKEYQKEYHTQNRDKILEYQKEYKQQNKDKIAEQMNAYQKIYYKQNRDKINEKIICECGSEISNQHLARHKKTAKHLTWEWRQTCLST